MHFACSSRLAPRGEMVFFPQEVHFTPHAGHCCWPNRYVPSQNLQIRRDGPFLSPDFWSAFHVCFWFLELAESLVGAGLLLSLTLRTSPFTNRPSDLICVFEASLDLQISLQRWSVNCCCCKNILLTRPGIFDPLHNSVSDKGVV